MDVLRTGCSVLGTLEPEKDAHPVEGARQIADRLMASFGSMLLYWYHFSTHGKRIETRDRRRFDRRALPASAARQEAAQNWVRAMHTSLILYAEHEFNASHLHLPRDRRHRLRTCTRRSPAASARCAARSTAARTRSPTRSRSATNRPTRPRPTSARRMAAKEIVIGFGHPVYTTGDPRNKVIKAVARAARRASASDMTHVSDRRAHRDR